MSGEPVICFGQQPCGFFPRRFLVAKIRTARRLQAEIGGRIVFFCHDSDHDPRETKTIVRHRRLGEPLPLNFAFANKWQRKYSPLYAKRVLPEWQAKTAMTLHPYVDPSLVQAFTETHATNVADFCLEMYERMGFLEEIDVVRSSDPAFREAACEIDDYYVDVPYEGEIVRARHIQGELLLHKGGDVYETCPRVPFGKKQISPARDTRLKWMQSVVQCTHYVAGASEQDYLRVADAPEINFVHRETIERADEAYTELQL
jgi:hypothetical protein